jgi:hypothetical protein
MTYERIPIFRGAFTFRRLRTGVLGLAEVTLFFASTVLLAQPSAQQSLDRFKSMAGTWEGKSPTGDTAEVTYRLQAEGSAVMAESRLGSENMTSMFYLDGDQLLMTHFCPSNNQPRMKATISPDLKTVTFDFLDATNLASPQAGHMHRVVYLFFDADHYSEEWTWKKGDKETRMHFEMQRKK